MHGYYVKGLIENLGAKNTRYLEPPAIKWRIIDTSITIALPAILR